jgi:hypothetical protein
MRKKEKRQGKIPAAFKKSGEPLTLHQSFAEAQRNKT